MTNPHKFTPEEDAVANGVRFLNEMLGQDWPDFIDRETLDLGSPADCIVGQQFEGANGGYWPLLYSFDFGEPDRYATVQALGFDHDTEGSYTALQAAWERYLDDYEDGVLPK